MVNDESGDLAQALLVVRLGAEVDDVGAEAGHAALAEGRAVGLFSRNEKSPILLFAQPPFDSTNLLGLGVHLVHHVHREEELLLGDAALQLGGESSLQEFC